MHSKDLRFAHGQVIHNVEQSAKNGLFVVLAIISTYPTIPIKRYSNYFMS